MIRLSLRRHRWLLWGVALWAMPAVNAAVVAQESTPEASSAEESAPPVLLTSPVPAAALPPEPATSEEQGSPPIDIEASSGIDWDRTTQRIIARGSARAVRGDLTVTGDVLTAFYRQKADGTTEVYRLDGAGNVKIVTPSQTAYGDAATYDMVEGHLTLTRDKQGKRLRVVTSDGEITADDRIDYNRVSRVMTARGNALAIQPGQQLKGDVITARLSESGGEGRAQFQQVDADGNVDALTPDERITADHGTYFGDKDTAVFRGTVKIFRGESVLDGCRAEFDLTSGFSKLLPCENAVGSKSRVRGVIVPSAKSS